LDTLSGGGAMIDPAKLGRDWVGRDVSPEGWVRAAKVVLVAKP
jgi:hypothetical protein